MPEVVNLAEKFAALDRPWSPRAVGEVSGHQVRVAKLEGEFTWHHHDDEDEMFLVYRGELTMRLRDKVLTVREGEFVIIPRGVEHKPEAKSETLVVLFEPAGTRNTGNVTNELTIEPDQMELL